MNQYELYHYGVPGMKWGHRKARPTSSVDVARANYKQARKDFNRAYLRADTRRAAAFSPIKSHRQANAKRWEEVRQKSQAGDAAKAAYKQAKAQDKQARKQSAAELSNKAQQYNQSRSTGAKVATNILGGAFANTTYSKMRAAGYGEKGSMAVASLGLAGAVAGNRMANKRYYNNSRR